MESSFIVHERQAGRGWELRKDMMTYRDRQNGSDLGTSRLTPPPCPLPLSHSVGGTSLFENHRYQALGSEAELGN